MSGRRAFLSALGALVPATALARPVRVGRFSTIPFGVSGRHPWPTFGGGAHRAFRTSRRVPARAPSMRTTIPLGAGASGAPTVLQSGLVVVVRRAGLLAIGADGETRWTADARGANTQPSVLPDGSLVSVLRNGILLRVRSGTAQPGVRTTAFGPPLALDDGSFVVPGRDGRLFRFDSNGDALFERRFVAGRPSPIVASDGRLLIAVAANKVHWFDLDGEPVSEVELPAAVRLGPSLATDGSVWVTDVQNNAHVLRAGRLVASNALPEGDRPTAQAVGRDGLLRYAAGRRGVVSLDVEGRERFRFEDGGAASGVVVDANGAALFSSLGGELIALDAGGAVRWRLATGSRRAATPVIGERGVIYLNTGGGQLMVLRGDEG